MANRYIEKPKEIKAIQYKGYDSLPSIEIFMGRYFEEVLFRPYSERLVISGNEREVSVGDYIAKDKKKIFHSIPRKIFESLYDKAE